MFQQRYIHYAFQTPKRSVLGPVLHDAEGFAPTEKLDAGQLRQRGGVEKMQNGFSFLGRVAGVQGLAVIIFTGNRGGDGGVQSLEACHRNTASPAACTLQIAGLQLWERAILRASE